MPKYFYAQREVGASERDMHAQQQVVQTSDAHDDDHPLSTPRKNGH